MACFIRRAAEPVEAALPGAARQYLILASVGLVTPLALTIDSIRFNNVEK